MVENLLHIVQREAAEDSQTTVQPQALSHSEGAQGGSWDDERSETGETDHDGTSQEGTSNVEVLLLFGSGTDDRNGSHHANGIEASTGEKCRRGECEERGDHGGLGDVESSPESILGNVAKSR